MAAPAEYGLAPMAKLLAFVFGLSVVIGLPAGYFSLSYSKLIEHVETVAAVKAEAVNSLVAANPDLWMYQLQRIEELLRRYHVSLASDRATVRDAAGNALVTAGALPDAPVLVRSSPVYDSGRVLGQVEISQSYRAVVFGTLVAALLGLLLGVMVYATLLVLPSRALRALGRANDALVQEKEALRAAEEQFRGLVEQSIAGIYIVQDDKLAYVNPRLAEILGYASAEELIGRDPLSVVAEQDRGIVVENMRQRIKGEAANINYSFTAVRKDGAMIEVGVHGARATHKGGPAIIGLMQDISEKKRAEEQIQRYVAQIENAFMSTVQVATTLGEMRDPYTAGHQRRVAEIAVAIGAELGFDARRQEGLRVAGYLHDVGKIRIPSEILAKPGRITAIEFVLIKEHAQAGYDVLKNVEFPWQVAEVALQHHERMDGSGYPQGLKGEAILLEARIMAVADVIEAMSSHRPYRAGLGIEAALSEIERGRGSAYDTDIVDACLRLFREQSFQLPA
jgi:PAS domain S-box-containing protein/putative nucleotidyltransferase with HDIG domain